MPDDEALKLARQVKNYLIYLNSLGVTGLPRVEISRPAEAALVTSSPHRPGQSTETLDHIRTDLGDCQRCALARGRTNLLFGEGDPQAILMFVSDHPGEEEDRQGCSFTGPAGQLLADIVVKGLKMRREDCFLAYVVKCRPPESREPWPEELHTCLPFLRRQIAALRPRVIITLGRVATQALLDTRMPLPQLRHRFHDFMGIPVMPTYHPAALLLYPEQKREVWEDIKLVIAKLRELSR